MKPRSPQHAVNNPADDPIAQAAADWVARNDRGLSAEEEIAFSIWLAADERHADAFEQHETVWRKLDGLTPLPASSGAVIADVRTRERGPALWWWAAAAAVFVLSSFFLWPSDSKPAEAVAYATVLGERREVVLPDGSVAQLNTDSRLEIVFSGDERAVRLLRGEAFFQVAKDRARPFRVRVDGMYVTAVGTEFNVRCSSDRNDVIVTEGRVEVTVKPFASDAAHGPSIQLDAGQRVVARKPTGGDWKMGVPTIELEENARALAWRTGRLEFEDAPLSDVVAEFNRYHALQLVMGDSDLADMRVGGSFRTENIDGFIQVLEGSFGLKANRDARTITLVKAK